MIPDFPHMAGNGNGRGTGTRPRPGKGRKDETSGKGKGAGVAGGSGNGNGPPGDGDTPLCEGARGARALCERCLRQRPGERIRCLSCNRRVGPGCTPGCLLVETVRAGRRQRTGLCVDWPHCGSSSPGAWTSVESLQA